MVVELQIANFQQKIMNQSLLIIPMMFTLSKFFTSITNKKSKRIKMFSFQITQFYLNNKLIRRKKNEVKNN